MRFLWGTGALRESSHAAQLPDEELELDPEPWLTPEFDPVDVAAGFAFGFGFTVAFGLAVAVGFVVAVADAVGVGREVWLDDAVARSAFCTAIAVHA